MKWLKEDAIELFNKYFVLIGSFIVFVMAITAYQYPSGEWDDYILPAFSIIREHNFTVSEEDVLLAEEYIPEWRSYMDNYVLSPFTAKNGEQLAWYYPTYSIMCIPMILLFNMLEIRVSYAFVMTNWIIYSMVLYCVLKYSSLKPFPKAGLLIFLLINPVIFYINWTSAEVMIYGCMVLSMLYWLEKHRKRAALFCAIAGTLNIVSLGLGVIMIIDFMLEGLKKHSDTIWRNSIKKFICQDWRDIILYGSIYIIALIPLAYNYYQTGHINLSAASWSLSYKYIINNFIAYFLDLNFGILPYFGLILIVAFVMLIPAVFLKDIKYIMEIAAFLLVVVGFSIVPHINCGMSGISRYLVWSVVILGFSVFYSYERLFVNRKIVKTINGIFIASGIWMCIIVYWFSLPYGRKYVFTNWTPCAEWTLNNIPSLYNPLHSTFVSRTLHFDGGYRYETPVFYYDNQGYVRKILANEKDRELLETVLAEEDNKNAIEKCLSKLSEEDSYINFDLNKNVRVLYEWQIGDDISFADNRDDAVKYFKYGIASNGWTVKKNVEIDFATEIIDKTKRLYLCIEINGTFNGVQRIDVYCNDINLGMLTVSEPQTVMLTLPDCDSGRYHVSLKLPDACSGREVGGSDDPAILALELKSAWLAVGEK